MVFVWRSISGGRRVTRSIVAIVGGITCLMIFRVGHMLSSLVENDTRLAAELDRIHVVPAEPEPGVGAQAPAIREINIYVTDAGSLRLDGRPLDDASLETALTKLAKVDSKLVIVISSDEFAPYQRVIDVLNLLAKARIDNVTFDVPAQE